MPSVWFKVALPEGESEQEDNSTTATKDNSAVALLCLVKGFMEYIACIVILTLRLKRLTGGYSQSTAASPTSFTIACFHAAVATATRGTAC